MRVTESMEDTATYFSHLRELVAAELKEEMASYRQSIAAKATEWSAGIREADCRFPLRIGKTFYNAMGQSIVEVAFDVDEEEIGLDFEPGKTAVLFTAEGDHVEELHMQCYVERVATGNIWLRMPTRGAEQSLLERAKHHLLGLHLGVDNTSYRVMDEALREIERSEATRTVHLREVVLGRQQPSFRQLPQMRFPWLNLSQQNAIQHALEAQEVAIIHGPPGTGKTTTLVEAIVETLHRETQVLVCAPSNAAVDWISEQLMRRGIAVLRVGNPLRMSDAMLECSYERRYAAHPDYHELWNIRKTLHEGVKGEKASRLRSRETELEVKINADLFDEARVVSCTLIGSAYRMMDHRHFGTLFIDEAAQALEPACWAAMLRADRVVMGGDHQQLPPTVKSREAAQGGLSNTLMQKLANQWPQCVSMLTVQYRMNEHIMAMPSRWFYGGNLKAAPEVAHRLVSPLDTPLTWIDTSHLDFGEKRTHGTSLTNAEEARLLIHTLRDYIDMVSVQKVESERIDFGIITPYRGQARLIRRLLRMQHFFRQLRRHISVGTVDSFQGRERDVVVISLVRDNADGNIGFMRDLRRMNVALTRARMKLIVVGNTTTLAHHRFYRQLIEHFTANGEVIDPST